MRRNIDAWWPSVASGEVEAIVMDASGCGAMVKEYAHALADDSTYAGKAASISALARDLSEMLPELVPVLADRVKPAPELTLQYHPPCTLQHAQKLRGGVERGLAELGFKVLPLSGDSHLCCGSAGTYSVLQPTLAMNLRDRKLATLQACKPDAVISANIGCIAHLQSGTQTPVMHWVEVLADSLET